VAHAGGRMLCLVGALGAGGLLPAGVKAQTGMALPALIALETVGDHIHPRRAVQSEISGFHVADIKGPAGQPIPVEVRVPAQSMSPVHILLVRGLPDEFGLANAVRIDDAWAVSPQKLSEVSLQPPSGYEGSFDLEFVLVWGPDRTRDIKTISVTIGDARGDERAKTAQEKTEDDSRSTPEKTVSPETEKAMLNRAMGIMGNGDIAAARLIFERLASMGSARGALAMAKTYDPQVLSNLNVFGLQPDLVEAAKWYKRAAQLGNEQASERLATIRDAPTR